jgi:hypothetical protein
MRSICGICRHCCGIVASLVVVVINDCFVFVFRFNFDWFIFFR